MRRRLTVPDYMPSKPLWYRNFRAANQDLNRHGLNDFDGFIVQVLNLGRDGYGWAFDFHTEEDRTLFLLRWSRFQ
jgi:hypothetical protein